MDFCVMVGRFCTITCTSLDCCTETNSRQGEVSGVDLFHSWLSMGVAAPPPSTHDKQQAMFPLSPSKFCAEYVSCHPPKK